MYKKIITLFLFFGITGMFATVYGTQLQTLETTKQYQEWSQLSEEQKNNVIVPPKYEIQIKPNNIEILRSIASSRILDDNSIFDLRDNISVKLKNQMNTSQCWAFATTTALETNLALTKQKENIEFSPRHIDYSTARTFLDGINELGHSREVGSNGIKNSGGGNYLVSFAYITSGRGPVLEKDMPFVNNEEKINLNEITDKQVQLKVNNTVEFPSVYKTKNNGVIEYTNGDGEKYTESEINIFRNSIKEHIKKYGAVIAVTCTENKKYFSNYNEEDQEAWLLSKAYNCDGQDKPDHQISIIGWDDNYAVTNFNAEHRPTTPGAYIVQNSYGSEFTSIDGDRKTVFNNGYIYISYEDFLIEQQIVGIGETTSIDYDNLYQYNPLGHNVLLDLKVQSCYLANRFTKKEGIEYLTQISVQANKGDIFEVYINANDGELTQNKLKKVKTENEILNSGYYTIKLDEAIKLEGQEFVVCLKKISKEESVNFYVEARETIVDRNYGTASSNANESFYSVNMEKWYDFKETNLEGYSDMNLTIKAFTVNDFSIQSNKYVIDNENLTCRVSPNTLCIDLKKNIISNLNMKIEENGEVVEDNSQLKTGQNLNVSDKKTYTIIVTGDVNGDGKITATDILCVKKDIVGIEKLNGVYATAADVNNTNSITSTDLLKIKQHIIGILSI